MNYRVTPVRTAVAAVAALAAGAFPSAAVATRYVWGSDLEAPANKTETHPRASAFWHIALPGGARVRAPKKGRVATLKLKGSAIKHGSTEPQNMFHFQVYHPTDDGKLRVSLTSGPFYVPIGGDRNRITTYHPVNLCAKKGDYVAFSNLGGYKPGKYPNGTPFRVFSDVSKATTGFFTDGSGINNTNVFTPMAPHVGEELLMRITLFTGDKAGYCQNH
jgi:hypothetical protein